MKIVVAGASGLVGTALVPALRAAGHDVVRLVRRAVRQNDEVAWDPAAGEIDAARLGDVDGWVNLAGENLGEGRWTAARCERILRSRVEATRTLVAAMTRTARKPSVFVSASAVGFYGDRGDEVLTEAASLGRGFLPGVCLAWETHAVGAERAGIRTVLARFGVILAPQGGALGKMLPIFRVGLGGRLGSGRQWMSWIGIDDVVEILQRALTGMELSGPVNVVAPGAVRNADFTAALGRVLGRPAIVPVPGVALRLALGTRMADEALLASTRAEPARLVTAGYRFRHAEIEGALRAVLAK